MWVFQHIQSHFRPCSHFTRPPPTRFSFCNFFNYTWLNLRIHYYSVCVTHVFCDDVCATCWTGGDQTTHPQSYGPDLIQSKRVCVCATVWGPGFQFLGTPNRPLIVMRDVAAAAIGPVWAHSNEGAGPQCTLGPNSSPLDTNPRVLWSCFVLTKSHTLCSRSSTHTHSYTNKAGAQRHRGMNPFKCMGSNTHRAHTHTHTELQMGGC